MNNDVLILLTAAAAGAAILVLMIALFTLARRSARAKAQGDVDDVVAQLTARVDDLAGDLQRALERAEGEGRRGRTFLELSASIDLDEVLARTLEAAGALPEVDGVLVSVETGDERPLVAAAGIALAEAERQAFAGPPEGHADSLLVIYRYADGEEGRVHSALAVPLHSESGRVGWLAVYARSRGRDLEDTAPDLQELAGRAGPAIDNALRFREARRLADLDALTGLHNRRYFHETLGREVARAQRYGRRLALVVIDLDDFKAINERIGHLAGDGVLAEAAERVRHVVRSADIACRVGGDEFAVILPESGIGQAEQLYRRMLNAVASRPIGQVPRLSLSAGVAELNEGDDATTIFERADEALYRAKEAGKARSFPALAPGPEAEEPPANSSSGVA